MGMNILEARRRVMMEQPHIETLVGNPVSFKAEALPLQELKVAITPVQDLHGQSSPYPPGGGVNKADLTGATAYSDGTYGMYVTVDGEEITLAGTWSNSNATGIWRFLKTPNIPSDLNVAAFESTSGNHVNEIRQDGTNKRLIITVTNMVNGQAYTIKFKIVAYEGSTAPTAWTPYSNICPISGHTGVNVSRTGKNLFGGLVLGQAIVDAVNNANFSTFGSNTDGNYVTIIAGSAVSYKKIKGTLFKPNTQYTLIFKITRYESGDKGANIRLVYTDGTSGSITFSATSDTEVKTVVYVTKSGKTVDHLETMWSGGTAYLFYEQSGIFEGVLTEADFEAYVGTVYPITWETAAGTVYGGTLDVVNGVLTMDRKYMLLDDPDKWQTATGTTTIRYNTGASDRKVYSDSFTGVICSYAVVDTYAEKSARWAGANSTWFGFRGFDNLTLEQVKSDASAGKIAILYELAEAVTYQLSAQQISSLLGMNNLWNDINGDNTVSFYTH